MEDIDIAKEIQKHLKGKTYSSLGLKGNPFLPEPDDTVTAFVNRDREKQILARYLVDLGTGKLSNIALLGFSGIGKTHFCSYLFHELLSKKIYKELGFDQIHFISGVEDFKRIIWSIVGVERDNLFSFFTEIKKPKITHRHLIMIDNADRIWLKVPEFAEIFEYAEKVGVVTTWNARVWNHAKTKIHRRIPHSIVVVLKPMTKEKCIEMLKRRIKMKALTKEADNLFTIDSLEEIAFLSKGNPYTCITIARKCVDFALEMECKYIDKSILENICQKLGFIMRDKIEQMYSKVTPRQREILQYILSLGGDYEFTPSELASEFGITRAGISQHLSGLKDMNFLKPISRGRYTKYKLRDEVRAFLDGMLPPMETELEEWI